MVPLAAAVGHHWAVNNGYGWVGEADDWLRPVATGGLVVAMVVDWRQLRWGKATVPDVLLPAEQTSRAGGLVSAANRFLPYTALAVVRFARARRQLLYAAARTRSEALHIIEPLRVAVAQTAALLDHAHHHGRWDATRIRAALRAARSARRRRWPLLAVPVLLGRALASLHGHRQLPLHPRGGRVVHPLPGHRGAVRVRRRPRWCSPSS